MKDSEALESIRTTWLQWAKTEIDNEEAFAKIAEALEQSGRQVIADTASTANDDHTGW